MFYFKTLVIVAIMAVSKPVTTELPNTVSLTVELQNVRFDKGGTLYVLIVDKNDKPIHRVTRPLSERNAVFQFTNLPTGEYAARAFHDENNNGELDKGIFGQPIEGWGVSNNARGFMSAPPFNKMLVGVYKDTKISFRIDY